MVEVTEPDDESRRVALRLALVHYARTIWALRRYSILGGICPAIGNVFIFYLPPLFVARLIDRVTEGDVVSDADIRETVLAFVVCWLIGEGWWRIGIHMLNRADGFGIERLYVEGMSSLLSRDLQFFHDNFGGSLTKRVVSYAQKFEPFFDTITFNIVGNVLPLGVAGVVLWRYDPLLVVWMTGLLVLTAAVVIPLIRRRQPIVNEREAASAVVAGHVADTLTNMDAVRTHAAELRELALHRDNVVAHRRIAIRSWDYHNLRIDGVAAPLAAVTNGVGLLLALSIGDSIDIEAVYLTLAYYLRATTIVFEFNDVWRNLESSATEAAQFTELLQQQPAVVDPDEALAFAPVDAGVRFDGITFAYPNASVPLFAGLDLDIASGEKVGVVGRSGGGKSTLTKLLLRLMDVDAGRIRVGGVDIRTVAQADVRAMIAYVPQDPVMFHRSIRDNMAFGRPEAPEDEIIAAAIAAHAIEFITDLPQGFDTLVGERGVKLSGGQRQRVAIARAILRDAPILVLDEATSALDSESESLIQDALRPLLEGRTALVVAHRLSTVQRMDRLVVLDEGSVIETGTHDELLRCGGTYASLWDRQSGGFLRDEA